MSEMKKKTNISVFKKYDDSLDKNTVLIKENSGSIPRI